MASELTYIVVPVHSRGEFDTRDCFTRCVETVERHTTNYRFIFVDDFCDDLGSQRIREVAGRHPTSYVVRTNKQRWFTRAVNLGLRFVRTPWAVVLNSDCVVDQGWLEELYAVRDVVDQERVQAGRKGVGLVGSVLSAEEGRRYAETSHPGYVTGHAWLLNIYAAFECSAVRGMPGWYLDETNPNMIHIRSDNEICERLNRLGYATVMSFKSAVGHVGGKSWGQQLHRIPGSLAEVSD